MFIAYLVIVVSFIIAAAVLMSRISLRYDKEVEKARKRISNRRNKHGGL
jgi:hypothetical protein